MSYSHTTVLKTEAVRALHVEEGKRYIDATLGGGGHTLEILRLGGKVLGLDTDSDAIQQVKTLLGHQAPHLQSSSDYRIEHANFRTLASIAQRYHFSPVWGVLFDLGVSNYQFDTPSRGFSYRFGEERLDLRLDQSTGQPAYVYINESSKERLYEDIATFSEEERTRTIVDALCSSRSLKKIETTGDVFRIIEQVVGARDSYAVASRIFQALRIVVNDELEALREALNSLDAIVASGGRVVVISFHSLEDRIVKLWMQNSLWIPITKKPVTPSSTEQQENRKSRSAKMRVVQKK